MNTNQIRKIEYCLRPSIALIVALWVPVRVLFINPGYNWDVFFELFMLAFVAIDSWMDLKRYKKYHLKTSLILFGIPYHFLFAQFLDPHFALVLFLPKLFILGQLKYIRSLLHEIDSLHPIVERIAPLAVVMPILVHLIACGWYWLEGGTGETLHGRFFEYGRAVYWTITTLTTVGYGDITPKTIAQMAYSGVTMIVGVAAFGYVLSNVAALISRLDGAREEYMSNLDRIETYMRYNNIPVKLRLRVRAYFRYLWESRKGYNDSEILDQLPQNLKAEVSFFINRDIIEKVPLLKGASQELVHDIVLQLKPLVTSPGEKIFNIGELGDAMYFIQKGVVEIVSKDGKILVELKAGAFFGEMALLTSNPRNATARAQDYCDLFYLDRDAFNSAISRYPAFEKHVKAIMEQRTSPKKKAS